MIKHIIVGVSITVSLFMANAVFAWFGFETASWDALDRVFWSLCLIIPTILCIVIGVNIAYPSKKD